MRARAMVLFLGAAAIVGACSTHDDGRTSTTTLTSAAPPIDRTSPYQQRPDMNLAGEICRREAECNATSKRGHWSDMNSCVRALTPRMQHELDGWQCDPAGSRARYKDCLAQVHDEPCATIADLEMRGSVCRSNASCGD
jgi:hypothetical protein